MSDRDRHSSSSILGVLSQQASSYPDRVCFGAMVTGTDGIPETEITFARLAGLSRRTASSLKKRGAVPGDRVILAIQEPLQFVGAFFGTLAAELVAVPLPAPGEFGATTAAVDRISGVYRDCRPKFIVIESKDRWCRFFGNAVSPCELIEWSELGLDDPAEGAPDDHIPDLDGSRPAVIQYTSGSTGAPRGVVVTHANIMANVKGIGEAGRLTNGEVVVSWLPLHHDMGLVAGILCAIYWKTHTYLGTSASFVSRPVSWLQAIHRHRATISVGPTFAYNLCYQRLSEQSLRGLDLSCWRLAFIGAETVGVKTALGFTDRFRAYGFAPSTLFPVYGLAEATLAVATPEPGEGVVIDTAELRQVGRRQVVVPQEAGAANSASYVSVGRALPGHEVMIIDPTTSEVCGEREVGEIVVRGPSVSPGYFGEREGRRRAQLHTGDLGYIASGRLYVIGRLKDLIIMAGQNYAPSDIEACVSDAPGLEGERCAAFSTPDDINGTESFAVVVEMGAKQRRRVDDLRQWVDRAIRQRFGVAPAALLFVPRGTLRRTTSGKIQRSACRQLFESGALCEVQYHGSTQGGLPVAVRREKARIFRSSDTVHTSLTAQC